MGQAEMSQYSLDKSSQRWFLTFQLVLTTVMNVQEFILLISAVLISSLML